MSLREALRAALSSHDWVPALRAVRDAGPKSKGPAQTAFRPLLSRITAEQEATARRALGLAAIEASESNVGPAEHAKRLRRLQDVAVQYRAEFAALVAQVPAQEERHRASLTLSPTFGPGLWLDGRFVARVAGTIEDSRITSAEPEPRWKRDAMVFVDAVNGTALTEGRDPSEEEIGV